MAVVVAGFLAGAINGVVGSGTLISYPVLLACGAPPIMANATNTAGLSVGSWSSAFAYRQEMAGRRAVLIPALVLTVVGAAVGALLVLALPERIFAAIVPWLILMAAALVGIGPSVTRWASRGAVRGGEDVAFRDRPRALWAATLGTGAYGGYFGAAQGVILMAVLGLLYDPDPQRSNAAKNLLSAAANLTAAFVFAVAGRVWWVAALLMAVGALVGGSLGARLARRLPRKLLRACVVVIGVLAAFVAWRLM